LAALGFFAHQSRLYTQLWKNDETLFRYIVSVHPNHSLARVNLGVLALERDDQKTAETEFVRATQGDRPLFSAWNNLYMLQMHQKNSAAAVTTAQGLTNIYPHRAESWYLLGNAHRAMENPQAALLAFQQAERLRPNSAMLLNAIGECLLQLNRTDEASNIQSRIHSRPLR
jgi:Flp pilus assembly protein TadD